MKSDLCAYYIKLKDSLVVNDTSYIVLSISRKVTNLAESLSTANPSKRRQNSASVIFRSQLLCKGNDKPTSLFHLYFAV